MEVRCTSCNKLFRVSDNKITGIGIKFSCTQCHSVVKITRAEFEVYSLSRSATQKAVYPAASTAGSLNKQTAAPVVSAMGMPAAAIAAVADPGNGSAAAAATVQGKPAPIVKAEPKAPLQPKPEIKSASRPKPEPASAARPPLSAPTAAPAQAYSPIENTLAAAVTVNEISETATGSSPFKKIAIVAVLLLVLGAAAFGLKSYFGKSSEQLTEAVRVITSPDGLQVQNAAGTIDQTNQDLIITGVIENTTDKPRPAWYIIVDVYDAQNAVITKGRLLNGKQLYSRRDFEILTKRGANLEDLRMRTLEQGTTIPPKGSVNFEIRLMEPPVGIASFNVTLQPFDPVQLFKEIAEEQK